MTFIFRIALVPAALIMFAASYSSAEEAPVSAETVTFVQADITLSDIEVRPGVTVDVHLVVFGDNPGLGGRTAFVLHGVGAGADFYQPLAHALFESRALGNVRRVVAINFPGKGLTGPPEGGLLLGELSIDDYATIALATLARLPEHRIQPDLILGHSLGGFIIQRMQQRLIDDGTTLSDAFGIERAVLVATVAPEELWPEFFGGLQFLTLSFEFCFSGPGLPAPPGCEFFDIVFGDSDGDVDWADFELFWLSAGLGFLMLDDDPQTTPLGEFSTLPAPPDGQTSGLGDVVTVGFFATESFRVFCDLLGIFGYEQPAIEPGIFDRRLGTELQLVVFENDHILPPEALNPDHYFYLTLDEKLNGYFEVPVLPDADGNLKEGHFIVLTDPDHMLDSLEYD